ncbi:hypothetical protein vseg_011295 [Gypsophila vaccaria]
MEFPTVLRSRNTFFVTILFFLLHSTQTLSQYHFFDSYCDQTIGNYTSKSVYKTNLNLLLPNLTDFALESHFDNYTVGQGIDKTYGLYLCRGDLNHQQCHDCVDAAVASASEKCPVQKAVNVWYQECLVRYSNTSIFEFEDENYFTYSWSTANFTNPKTFHKVFGNAIENLIQEAAYGSTNKPGYAAAEEDVTLFETVYVVGICTPDIVGYLCERCLRVALSSIAGCCGTARVSMYMFLPSCWIQYDTAPFLLDSLASAPEKSPDTSPDMSSSSSSSSSSSDSPPFRPSTPSGTSTTATISPMWICFAFLLMGINIPNYIIA